MGLTFECYRWVTQNASYPYNVYPRAGLVCNANQTK